MIMIYIDGLDLEKYRHRRHFEGKYQCRIDFK